MAANPKQNVIPAEKVWTKETLHHTLGVARAGSLFTLQSTILDISQSELSGSERLDQTLTLLRDAFNFDATMFFAVNTADTDNVVFACTDKSIKREDVHQSILHFGLAATGGTVSTEGLEGAKDYKLACFQFVSDNKEEKLPRGIFVGLLKSEDDLDPVAKSALAAIVPSFRLLADALETKRKLNEANDRFHTLSNSLPGVVYQRVVKPDGEIRYTYISESAIDLFGIPAEEILSNPKALFASYAPEYRDHFRDKLLEASRNLTKWDVEASIIMPDGTVKFTHAIASPRKQADGSVLWTGVILDAERIKEAERNAAETEERTRKAIVESLSQGFVMFDSNDKLILCNSAFEEIFEGADIGVFEGQSYQQFVTREMVAAYPELVSAKRLYGMQAERIGSHREGLPYNAEYQLRDDRWLQVNEHRTSDGTTVIVYTDVSAIKIREARIQHMAMHDSLTGLPNRVLFRDRSQQAIKDAQRYNTHAAILALDLDNFKIVNDTLGHPAGDKLLQIVSARISRVVRESDTLARLGGDEFAVIMRDIDELSNVDHVAKRIIDAVAEPIELEGNQVVVGVSIGVGVCSDDISDQDDLIKNADLALYRAKRDGKNTYRFFEKSMDELTRARRQMENDLRHALNESHLELHFQPQVNLNRREITGFEALVRWTHPERGSVSPTDFITIAEETGLINQLGEWVLYNACKCAAGWSKPSKIAINLSPAQFNRPGLVEFIEHVLEETKLDPKRLELEITEGLLLHNTNDTMEILYRLKGLGIRIAMDDFGTGYSSLGNLRSFPFDRIKIDKSFVMNLKEDPESAAIVTAVVGLGKNLGMETTAEGVETVEQLEHLEKEGCSDIQGFYYSHARPNEEIDQLLQGDVDGFNSLGLKHLNFE